MGFSDPCIFNSNLKTCLHAIFDHWTSRIPFEVFSQYLYEDSKILAPDVYFAEPVKTSLWVIWGRATKAIILASCMVTVILTITLIIYITIE